MTQDRRVRMLDIAAAAGLSRATVSLVMRHSPLVSESTRAVVLREADRLGYVYHRGAANLRSQRSDVVAVVMPDIVNPFVGEVSLGAQEVLAEHGFFVMIANTQDQLESQRQVIRSVIEQRVAGVITIPVLDHDEDLVPGLVASGMPVVLLTRNQPESGLPFVGPDDAAIGQLAARHLLDDHACESVAYFGGNAVAAPRVVRAKAFRRAVGRRAPIDPRWNLTFDASLPQAYAEASLLLDAGPPPRGVQCHSDSVAYGLLRALHEHGLGVDACRVVGIDDLQQSAAWNPSVSSIAVHPVELGRITGRTLLRHLGHPDLDPGRPPIPTLSRRESCGCTERHT